MAMKAQYTFFYTTKIVSGPEALDLIGDELKISGVKKTLIVTDKVMAGSETMAKAKASLAGAGNDFAVFEEVEPDPSVATVEAAAELLRLSACDSVMGLGGGSALDAAKGAAILGANDGPISQYEGANKIPNPPCPIFAVPTTAGTGSEVSQSSILADGPVKRSIRSTMAAPRIAFLDPLAVSTVPAAVAVSSGLDALAHNIESYLSLWASPVSECLSKHGIKLAAENLRPYMANPRNQEAAGNMQLSALLGAAAFANSRVGLPHALGMALGGLLHLPHGLACGLALAPCMEYSWIGNPGKYRTIAELMGVNTRGLTEKGAANAAVKAVVELIHSLDTVIALRAHGVKDEHLGPLAEEMIRAGLQLTDPRQSTLDDARAIIGRAMNYDL